MKQTALFRAAPSEVYELIMDSKKHAAFSGGSAKISRKVGGKISAYDGWITGKNLKIVPNRKIVQEWRGDDWPKAHYSVVTFDFRKSGTGTRLTFTQKGIPAVVYNDIKEGWREHYWSKMKNYLGE